MVVSRLDPKRSVLLVIDVQEKLLPQMRHGPEVVETIGRLMDGFAILGLPVLLTEQYPEGLGPTVEPIARRLVEKKNLYPKMAFSAVIAPIRQQLHDLNVASVILAGVEAHVCVLQTALDLMDSGLVTAVALDAVSSRQSLDAEAATHRMIRAGIITTTVESALFELTVDAGTDRFRQILKLIR